MRALPVHGPARTRRWNIPLSEVMKLALVPPFIHISLQLPAQPRLKHFPLSALHFFPTSLIPIPCFLLSFGLVDFILGLISIGNYCIRPRHRHRLALTPSTAQKLVTTQNPPPATLCLRPPSLGIQLLPMSLVDPQIRTREHPASIPDITVTEQETHIESLLDSRRSDPSDTHENLETPDVEMISSEPSTAPVTPMEGAPALPQKSSLRASRMLDLNIHKLAAEQPPFTQTAPLHDAYLSSEEDASSCTDDFSDFDFESGSEDSETSAKRRGSHEDTARVVSVVFAGKPSLVDLPRRSMSPSSNESTSRPPSRLRRTSTDLSSARRRLSIYSASASSILHPPRTSSISPRKLEKQRPNFLSIDPFAAKAAVEEKEETPKTPTAMFKRTLSLVRKKSRPSLNHAFNQSRDSLALPAQGYHHMEQVQEIQEEPVAEEPHPAIKGPFTYQEILKSAKRRTQTQPISPMSPMSETTSPVTPNGTRHRLRHFSSSKRRSIKI